MDDLGRRRHLGGRAKDQGLVTHWWFHSDPIRHVIVVDDFAPRKAVKVMTVFCQTESLFLGSSKKIAYGELVAVMGDRFG